MRDVPSVLIGRRARIYQFPPTTAVAPAAALPKRRRLSNFRIHLAVELTVGLFLWLVWFVWHLMQ
jgi:hypothetical protein